MNIVEELRSTADLRRVQRQMRRRAARLMIGRREVVITRAGGMYRARLAGGKDAVLGDSPEQCLQRLRTLLASKPVRCGPKHCDQVAERKERQAERAIEKAAKRDYKFDPKRYRA
jgi:hypothetical protein